MKKVDVLPFMSKRVNLLYYSRKGNKNYTGFLRDIHTQTVRLDMSQEKNCYRKSKGRWLTLSSIIHINVSEAPEKEKEGEIHG